jgi:hypothetical protein
MDGVGEVAPGPGVWIGAGVVAGLTGAVAVGVLEGRGRGGGGLTAAAGERDWHHRDRQRRCGYSRTYGLHGKPP